MKRGPREKWKRVESLPSHPRLEAKRRLTSEGLANGCALFAVVTARTSNAGERLLSKGLDD